MKLFKRFGDLAIGSIQRGLDRFGDRRASAVPEPKVLVHGSSKVATKPTKRRTKSSTKTTTK